MDATYKTNRYGHELYAIIASVDGVGFPVAYMFVNIQQATDNSQLKTRAIATFCTKLKQTGFEPKYFFTDKDMAQINAIEDAFGDDTKVSLCLWHMQRSIEKKLASQIQRSVTSYFPGEAQRDFDFVDPNFAPPRTSTTQRSGVVCLAAHRKIIKDMTRKHYNMHSSIPIVNEGTYCYIYTLKTNLFNRLPYFFFFYIIRRCNFSQC